MESNHGKPASNPFAPPGAEVADVNEPGAGPVLATRGSRFLAAMVDVVLQIGLVLLLGTLLGRSVFANDNSVGHVIFIAVLGAVVFFGVHGLLLVRHGQTWGKRWLGLRIVRRDGSRVSAGRMLGLRYGIGFVLGPIPVLGMIYTLIDSLLIFRASRQCLHDNIADTIVVKA